MGVIVGARARRRVRAAALLGVVVLATGGWAVDLGSLGGGQSQARDINERGVVVGTSILEEGGANHAFRKAPGRPMVDLNGSFDFSEALAVNDRGVAVGYGMVDGRERAVRWAPDGTAHDLGAPDGSRATDINNRGVVVGYGPTAPGDVIAGFVWDPRTRAIERLPYAFPDGELFQRVDAINNDGTIVGQEYDAGGTAAVVWSGRPRRPSVLPEQAGQVFTWPMDVNDDGTIVGTSTGDLGQRAIVWHARAHRLVDITPPGVQADARGINQRGEIVGVSVTGTSDRAVFWDARTRRARDLGDLGGGTAQAIKINDRGVAVGWSTTGATTPTGYPVIRATLFTTSHRHAATPAAPTP